MSVAVFVSLPQRTLHYTSYTFCQVFQTFACEEVQEIGKSYLRADFRIQCDTPRHAAYKIYAAVMILLCEFMVVWNLFNKSTGG